MVLQIKVVHDVSVPSSNVAVLTLVTAAEGLIVRAKLEVQWGPEGGAVIQALGVPLQQAHPVQQECEAEAENARRGRELGALPTQTLPGNRFPQHRGLGSPQAAVFAQVDFPALG